ncbi:MAG: HYR domain-containing protein [Saprospiraceae bacterium]|nr:HYR domain-containing protein [Saprospiraceae bacterium]
MKTFTFPAYALVIFLFINSQLIAQQSETRYASSATIDNPANWTDDGRNALGSGTGVCLNGSNIHGWIEFGFGNFNVTGQVVGIEVCVKYLSQSGPNDISLKYNGQVLTTRTLPKKANGSYCDDTNIGCVGGSTDNWSANLYSTDFNNNNVIVRIDQNANSLTIDYITLTVYTDGINTPPDCSGATIANKIANGSCKATISGSDVSGIIDLSSRPVISVSPTTLTGGDNIVTVTANDGEFSCSHQITVTVLDDKRPNITCPSNITIGTNLADDCGANVVMPSPSSSDNCGVFSLLNSYNNTSDGDDIYPLGTTTVTWTATDASGNFRSCNMTVKVLDDDPPQIICSGNVTVLSDDGVCNAQVTVPKPGTSDNCSAVSITNDYTGTSDASGEYPPGETTITWTAVDAAGNSATCTQTITVNPGSGCIQCNDPDFDVIYADVEQLNANDLLSSGMDGILWQSFTAGGHGTLATIEVWLPTGQDLAFGGGDFILYEGEGTSGRALINSKLDASSGHTTIDLSVWKLFIFEGQIYTIYLKDSIDDFAWEGVTGLAPDGPYPGGHSSTSLMDDHRFAVNLSACDPVFLPALKVWTGAQDSVWENSANWSPASVPNYNDSIIINPTGHHPVVASGTFAKCNFIDLKTGSSLTVRSGGKLSIENSSSFGIILRSGTILKNEGYLEMGRYFPIGFTALANSGTVLNNGDIYIGECGSRGIYNFFNQSSFTNQGMIQIGADGGSLIGIYNEFPAILKNEESGIILIDSTGGDGIFNSGIFTNSGEIVIGNYFTIGGNGLTLDRAFTNDTTALLTINRTVNNAISMNNIILSNYGRIDIGKLSRPGGDGFNSFAGQLNNYVSGEIVIEDVTQHAFFNFATTTSNYGNISIGKENITIGNYRTIENNGPWTNHECAEINIVSNNGLFSSSNFSDFLNQGLIIENASDSSRIQTNEGKIRNLNGGDFQIDQDNGTLVTDTQPFWSAKCKNAVVVLDESGIANIDPLDIDDGSGDNDPCTQLFYELSQQVVNCNLVATPLPVKMRVSDLAGAESFCEATVTVLDTLQPIAKCQNISIALDETGNSNIIANQIDNGSTDGCYLTSLTLDRSTFNCDDLGIQEVVLTVMDQSLNSDTCHATVTVSDPVAPVTVCQNLTVYLDENGTQTITPAQIDAGSYDLCQIQEINLDETTFDCNDVGTRVVVMTVTDGSSNQDTCHAMVTILDTIAPVVRCKNITLELDTSGTASLDPTDIDDGSTDNCQVGGFSLSKNIFSCTDVGDQTVTLTVSDIYSNQNTCQAIVTVQANQTNGLACVLTCADCITQPENTWTGLVNDNWNEAGNWSLNAIPTICHQVIINTGNVSILSGETAVCYTLTVDPDASLDQALGSDLIVGECLSE